MSRGWEKVMMTRVHDLGYQLTLKLVRKEEGDFVSY